MRTFTSSRLQRKLSKMYSQKFEEHKAIIKIENQMNYNSKDDVLVNDRME